MKHWREIVADAMEKHPGVKIDRELYHSLDLPKKQREAFCKREEEMTHPTNHPSPIAAFWFYINTAED